MKILINAPFSDEHIKLLQLAAGENEVVTECCDDADIIVGELPYGITQKNLKLLQLAKDGAEKYCADGFLPDDVIIANATGAFGEVISEYVIGALLAMYRDLFAYRDNQRRHLWQDTGKERLIYGSRVLILGCGDIGRGIATKLKPFGATVYGIRRTPCPTEGFDAVYGTDSLDKLLPHADIVICCLPHTSLTAGIINAERIALMRKGAFFVNVGRGSAVDSASLINALKSGALSGAVLDVFESEPLDRNSELWNMENVLITPHISGPSFGHSDFTQKLIAQICADNISHFLLGEQLCNVVNRKDGYVVK